MTGLTMILGFAAAAFSGVLAGASLDQSIKQLPARRRMGMIAYAAYARAADLGNGIAWYAAAGVGAAILTIAAAVSGVVQGAPALAWLVIAAVLAALHSLATTQAAPLMLSMRGGADDETTLARIFDRFERWQAIRAGLQVLAFLALLGALVARA